MAQVINEVEQAQLLNRDEEANEVDRVEEANEVDRVEEANEVDGVEQANEGDRVEEANEVNRVEQANEVDRVEEVEEQSNLAGLEYCFTPGIHVHTKLLYTCADRQLFRKNNQVTTGIRYICHFAGCRSRVNLKDGICTYIINNHQHGHQENEMKQFKLKHDIKVRVGNETGLPRQIFNEECALNESVSNQLQFGRMRRSLNQNRRRGFPANPRTMQEVEAYFENEFLISKLFEIYGRSSSSFYKCTVITDDFSYTIFASDSILSRLQQQQQYLIDGTFKIVPAGPFKQLLTISVENQAHIFTVFYVLMTRRTEAAYLHLFKYIVDHWELKPSKFMSDYERGMRNALRRTFIGIPVKGCFFHFAQANRKYASQIPNFFEEIWRNNQKKKLYHKLLSLPLMKQEKILESFLILKAEAESLQLETPFKSFLKYYERQWIQKEGPSNISVYAELNRTNNLTESYNGQLKKLIPCHGGMFDFVKLLLKEEATKSREYGILLDGGDQVFERQRRQYANRDAHIKTVQKRFEDGTIDIATFFNQLTFADNTGSIRQMDTYDVDDADGIEENYDEENDDEAVYEEDGAVGGLLDEPVHVSQLHQLRQRINEMQNVNVCVVCLANTRDTMIEPCGHVRTCGQCTATLLTNRYTEDGFLLPKTCPICRGTIEHTRRVFL